MCVHFIGFSWSVFTNKPICDVICVCGGVISFPKTTAMVPLLQFSFLFIQHFCTIDEQMCSTPSMNGKFEIWAYHLKEKVVLYTANLLGISKMLSS